MKALVAGILAMVVMSSCQKSEVVSAFTGNQTTYALQSVSAYPVSGTVTFKERKDGAVTVLVKLSGTSAGTRAPVHLHMGDISSPSAAVAALLSPVDGQTGISETRIDKLGDESVVTYSRLTTLNACMKIHLSNVGPEKDIILAAGNIGSSSTTPINNGRIGVTVCKSF